MKKTGSHSSGTTWSKCKESAVKAYLIIFQTQHVTYELGSSLFEKCLTRGQISLTEQIKFMLIVMITAVLMFVLIT